MGSRLELHSGPFWDRQKSLSIPANSHRRWFLGHSPQRCYNNAIMRRVKYVVNHTLVVETIFVACTPGRT